MTERDDIHTLRLQLIGLLQHSIATDACKAVALLMTAATACRACDMPQEVATRMLTTYYSADPL